MSIFKIKQYKCFIIHYNSKLSSKFTSFIADFGFTFIFAAKSRSWSQITAAEGRLFGLIWKIPSENRKYS